MKFVALNVFSCRGIEGQDLFILTALSEAI